MLWDLVALYPSDSQWGAQPAFVDCPVLDVAPKLAKRSRRLPLRGITAEERRVDCLSRGKTLKLHPASSATNVLISKLQRAVSRTNPILTVHPMGPVLVDSQLPEIRGKDFG